MGAHPSRVDIMNDAPLFTKYKLLNFLGYAQEKGLFNTNTVGGMKAAIARILEDVNDEDDVRKVDISTAINQYSNRHPGILSPGSLRTYSSRIETAVSEFVKFQGNPAAYKAPVQRATNKNGISAKAGKKSATEQPTVAAAVDIDLPVPAFGTEMPTKNRGLMLEFPMRDDFLAQVLVPRDMDSIEARRFAHFITTLARDFVPH